MVLLHLLFRRVTGSSECPRKSGYLSDGSTSSSDGQRFRAGGQAERTGHVNLKYGTEPGRMFYTHLS
ncbi:Tn3 family transposase, partial [Sphaerotilus natans subsp. sulfidivorans]|nr:Tn3 family transposase [Sphaerotilus sulfidivorans]